MHKPLIIEVEVSDWHGNVIKNYTMNHDDMQQRRVMGEQIRNAFEAGQQVWTCPVINPVTGEQ